MLQNYKKEQIEILITNISSDIDDSFRKKITDFRLNASIIDKKKLIMKYISKEKSGIIKSINNVSYKSRRGTDEYLGYLLKDPYNDYLRRDAIESFIETSILGAWKDKFVLNLLDSKVYEKSRSLDPIKSFIERAILLEYSFFLTDEIKNINKKENKENKDDIKKSIHPFVDNKMLELFNYIIEKWNYDKHLKYSYIFNEIMPENHPPGEYENYIRINYEQIGKFNYNNANSEKIIQNLRQIIKSK
jgi:hypothetical protein